MLSPVWGGGTELIAKLWIACPFSEKPTPWNMYGNQVKTLSFQRAEPEKKEKEVTLSIYVFNSSIGFLLS